jgi:hypothetical protein
MDANRGMVEASMNTAGYCVDSRGGAYKNGKAQPLQDKATIAHKYFELEENLLAGQRISVLSLANACAVSWGFANKVVREIESGQLINPKMKIQGRTHDACALTLLDADSFYLLHLQNLNN